MRFAAIAHTISAIRKAKNWSRGGTWPHAGFQVIWLLGFPGAGSNHFEQFAPDPLAWLLRCA